MLYAVRKKVDIESCRGYEVGENTVTYFTNKKKAIEYAKEKREEACLVPDWYLGHSRVAKKSELGDDLYRTNVVCGYRGAMGGEVTIIRVYKVETGKEYRL